MFCTFFRFLSPQHVQIITTFFRRLCAYSTLSYAFSTIYRYFHFVSPSFLCFYVKFQQILLVMFRCPPPLLGRNAENLSKITIKSGYCCESAVQCNVTYGGICLSQLFARCPDPNPVDIFHRRHPHGFLKNTAQMCLTDVAHIRKFFNPDALVEIFPDISSAAERLCAAHVPLYCSVVSNSDCKIGELDFSVGGAVIIGNEASGASARAKELSEKPSGNLSGETRRIAKISFDTRAGLAYYGSVKRARKRARTQSVCP